MLFCCCYLSHCTWFDCTLLRFRHRWVVSTVLIPLLWNTNSSKHLIQLKYEIILCVCPKRICFIGEEWDFSLTPVPLPKNGLFTHLWLMRNLIKYLHVLASFVIYFTKRGGYFIRIICISEQLPLYPDKTLNSNPEKVLHCPTETCANLFFFLFSIDYRRSNHTSQQSISIMKKKIVNGTQWKARLATGCGTRQNGKKPAKYCEKSVIMLEPVNQCVSA